MTIASRVLPLLSDQDRSSLRLYVERDTEAVS